MRKRITNISRFTLLFLILATLSLVGRLLYAETRTITADVTGDNMNDAIKVTENAVYVVDRMLCCTRKRFPIISSCTNIHDVLVDNFSTHYRGNEVAIIYDTNTDQETVVYAFKNGSFSLVSDTLPGIITFWNNVLCSDESSVLDSHTVTLPWPIIDEQGYLRMATRGTTNESHILVEPGEVYEDTLILQPDVYTRVVIWTTGQNTITILRNKSGDVISGSEFEDRTVVGVFDPREQNHALLYVDNTRSVEHGMFRCLVQTFGTSH